MKWTRREFMRKILGIIYTNNISSKNACCQEEVRDLSRLLITGEAIKDIKSVKVTLILNKDCGFEQTKLWEVHVYNTEIV
jgi:hypothetical protein